MIVSPKISTATIRKMASSGERTKGPSCHARKLQSPKIEQMDPNQEFYRIQKLPPYVFAVINEMKTKARAAQLDVVDLGMGNPDGSTPRPIVSKLVEAARNQRNHRYSMS